MRAFGAGVANELSKLMSRRKYIVFLCIGAAICCLWALLGNLISGAVSNMSRGISLSLSSSPMGVLPFFLQVLVPFLMFMGITDLFTVEASDSTMKASLIRPVERWKLYSAKLCAVMLYAAGYLICIFVFSSLIQAAFGQVDSLKSLLLSFVSYLLALVPLAVLCCFASLIALFGRSGTLVMFLLILAYLLLCVLPFVIPVLSQLLFTSYLGWYKLFVGALPAFSSLSNMLLIVLGYGTVFFTAGSLIFDRKEY